MRPPSLALAISVFTGRAKGTALPGQHTSRKVHMTITESSARPAQQRPTLSEQRPSRLPGPPWHTTVGNTLRFLRHTLDFSQEMRDRYGDVVSVPTLKIGR